MIRYLGDYPGVFDIDQIRLMTAALNGAWTTVQRSQATYAIGDEAEPTRTALAKHIIKEVNQGEHDPRRLSEGALADLAGANKR